MITPFSGVRWWMTKEWGQGQCCMFPLMLWLCWLGDRTYKTHLYEKVLFLNRWKKKANGEPAKPSSLGKLLLQGGVGSLVDAVCDAVANLELERQRVRNSSCSSWQQSVANTRGLNSRSLKPILSWKVLGVLICHWLLTAVNTFLFSHLLMLLVGHQEEHLAFKNLSD